MVACCKGFIDIVYRLYNCPFIDINHQDNEGNTALMIASQAGRSVNNNRRKTIIQRHIKAQVMQLQPVTLVT